jgi:hypothetical protein
MVSALDQLQRGFDSSGRRLLATAQMFQHFDRVNAVVGGRLVIVQGSFNRGLSESAGTHDLAGAIDVRTWNLSASERERAMRAGRDPSIVGGAAWWYRTEAQGFDPHMHVVLLGDAPMSPQTLDQAEDYRDGLNGLANERADDFWRPATITNYRYIEDDMADPAVQAQLDRIEKAVKTGFANERSRDQKDRERFSRLVDALGKQADVLTLLYNESKDDATKAKLRRAKAEILEALKSEPDVDGVDNPSDDAMATEI